MSDKRVNNDAPLPSSGVSAVHRVAPARSSPASRPMNLRDDVAWRGLSTEQLELGAPANKLRIAKHAASNWVKCQRTKNVNEKCQVNDAVNADDVTIKKEPTDIFNSDIPRDKNTTMKHGEHDLQLPWYHVVVENTVVKNEPADVDDVYSSEVVGSAGPADDAGTSGAATTMKQENERTDIFNSNIPRDKNTTMKHGEHDLQLPWYHVVVENTVVKNEPADVDDVYSSEVVGSAGPADDAGTSGAATTMKQENEPTDIFNSNIPRDTNTTMKHEERDLQLPWYPVVVETTVVKSEPADVDDVYSSEVVGCAATTMKQENEPTDVFNTDIPRDTNTTMKHEEHDLQLPWYCVVVDSTVDSSQQPADVDNVYSSGVVGSTSGAATTMKQKMDIGPTELQPMAMQSGKSSNMLTHARPHKCEVCFKSFQKKTHMKNHMLLHTGDRPHKCDVCFKSFQTKTHVKNHMLTHSGNRPHKCDVCFNAFKSKNTLKEHMYAHTGDRPHKCDACFKTFKSKNNLKNHMLTHTSDRPYKCDVCFNSFKYNSNLKNHMVTHTGDQSLKCDVCFMSFRTKKTFKTHMSSHSAARPHKCNVCFKSFLKKAHIKDHMLTHTGDRPHKCDVCFKSFQTKGNINIHMLTHTGERPHKCDACFKTFKTKYNLKKHMSTHSDVRPHKCDVCFKAFKSKTNLKDHILTHG